MNQADIVSNNKNASSLILLLIIVQILTAMAAMTMQILICSFFKKKNVSKLIVVKLILNTLETNLKCKSIKLRGVEIFLIRETKAKKASQISNFS